MNVKLFLCTAILNTFFSLASPMDDQNHHHHDQPEPQVRPAGQTEHSFIRAVPGGTGITVCALLLSKPPDTTTLQNALHKIQNFHPILRSKLVFTTSSTSAPTFTIPPTSHLQLQIFDLSSTSQILQQDSSNIPCSLHRIAELELNRNSWTGIKDHDDTGTDVFFASLYAVEDSKSVLALRFHTSVCDRTTVASLLRELCGSMLMSLEKSELEGDDDGVSLAIEELIPSEKKNKAIWARGLDLLGYSLNSFRFCHLDFKDSVSSRSSGLVRLQMVPDDTRRLLAGCKERGIKLFGALAAASMMAAYSSKKLPDRQWEKYAVITLVDCRSLLHPPLQHNNFGFYHSAVLITHDVQGESTEFWDLAKRCFASVTNSIKANKHFSDMNDMNFLMCKALDNPGLTPSSSLRTSLISVFEDPVVDDSGQSVSRELGLVDFVGCSSVHGIGPSIAIFDTLREGGLDCACVYPMQLHSREQMEKLIANMKRILINEGLDNNAP